MKTVSRIILIVLFWFLFAPLHGVFADAGRPDPSFRMGARGWVGGGALHSINALLEEAVIYYKNGKTEEAKRAVTEAYFDGFEASGMEDSVAARISEKRKMELEGLFGELRGAIIKGKPLGEIEEKKGRLINELGISAASLDKKGDNNYTLVFNSLLIILREGFEAILIISALVSYLVKTGNPEKSLTVYAGAGAAIVLSLFTAVIFGYFIKISGAAREAVEGITMLVATGVLFYVSYWLISKAEANRWHRYIKERVDSSITKGSAFALGVTSFLAVYREGAETILFYHALYAGSNSGVYPLALGFTIGAFVLFAVFLVTRYLAIKIPIKVFFPLTSLLLYYLAFTFAGKGVLELQEAGWFPTTVIQGIKGVGFIGFYPTLEGIIAQSLMVLLFFFAMAYLFIPRKGAHQ